jgi:hypothetical protein
MGAEGSDGLLMCAPKDTDDRIVAAQGQEARTKNGKKESADTKGREEATTDLTTKGTGLRKADLPVSSGRQAKDTKRRRRRSCEWGELRMGDELSEKGEGGVSSCGCGG